MNEYDNLVKVKNMVTGEIKLFAGTDSAYKFLKTNSDYLVWAF